MRAARRRSAPPSSSSASCFSAGTRCGSRTTGRCMTKGSLLPRRRHPRQRGQRPRPGAVGHRRQALRRAGAPAARRAGARPDPGLRLGRRRRTGRGGRPHPRAGRGGPDGREDERQRPDEPAGHRGRDRRRRGSGSPPPARCSATTATWRWTSTAASPWPTPGASRRCWSRTGPSSWRSPSCPRTRTCIGDFVRSTTDAGLHR